VYTFGHEQHRASTPFDDKVDVALRLLKVDVSAKHATAGLDIGTKAERCGEHPPQKRRQPDHGR
jgi:hypothetical protein